MKRKGHLKDKEREKIYLYLNQGLSLREIGRKIGRDHTVILREIERNKSPDGTYRPFESHRVSAERKCCANRRNPLKHPGIHRYVKDKLHEKWSPEQISGRIRIDLGLSISHETIYQYIYRKENKKDELWVFLRRKRPRRMKKQGRKVRREFIPNRVFIDKRPECIESREHIGHWESDLMEGKRETKDVVSVTAERKSRMFVLGKMENKTSKEKADSLKESFEKLPPWMRKSITFDNGSENAKHERIANEFSIDTYFCHPYHSWEKGTVENIIGLIREYLPKKTSIEDVTQRDLNLIAYEINTRPRKVLGYSTPHEVFYRELSGAF